jgi:hypothetical protein
LRALRAAQIPLIKKAKARQIADRVQEIKQFTAAVAASVQQQDAATGEISHNVASAARETKEIVSVFHEVASAATETRGSAETMLDTSKSVETAATDLRTEVEGFLEKVRLTAQSRFLATRMPAIRRLRVATLVSSSVGSGCSPRTLGAVGCGQHDERGRITAFQLSPCHRKHNQPDQLHVRPSSDRIGIA